MAERRKGVRSIAAILAVQAATLGGAATEISAQEPKPAAETQPAAAQASEAAKGPNTGRNDGDRVQVIGTVGLAFAY